MTCLVFFLFKRPENARLLCWDEILVVDLVVEKVVEFVVENQAFSRHFVREPAKVSESKKPRKHWRFRGFFSKKMVGHPVEKLNL